MPVKSERQKNMWNKIRKLNLYFSWFFKGTYIAVMKLRKMDLFDIILKCRPNYNSFLDIKLLTAEVSKLLFNQINWWFEKNP